MIKIDWIKTILFSKKLWVMKKARLILILVISIAISSCSKEHLQAPFKQGVSHVSGQSSEGKKDSIPPIKDFHISTQKIKIGNAEYK